MARNDDNDRNRDSEGRFTSDDQRSGARSQSNQGNARNESHGSQQGSMDRKRDEDGRFTSDSASRGSGRGEAKSDDMKRSGR